MLVIHGKEIPTKLLLKKIIGLPSRGQEVKIQQNVDQAIWDQFSLKGKAKTINQVIIEMNAHKDEEDFVLWYMIIILFFYLTPSSNIIINKSLLAINMNKDNIKHLDWCKFIVGWLMDGIKRF